MFISTFSIYLYPTRIKEGFKKDLYADGAGIAFDS